jgi:large subunit ribosomal protein L17
MSRKNMHGKVGVKFKAGFTKSKEKSMLRNLATDLIIHGHVTVTDHTSHQLVSLIDGLITLAKKGDLAARRQAAKTVRDIIVDPKAVKPQTALQKLFDELGPKYQTVNGGYSRILKVANRRGDNSPMALVQFVD